MTTLQQLTPADAERRRRLVQMKLIATGMLVLMACIFVVAFALQDKHSWLGYVRAAAEAGMVGALADWFAVTALFRRPLGLPIPHTAIIPSRKDAIGSSLSEFVATNFLSEEVIREKLSRFSLASKLGGFLASPQGGRPHHCRTRQRRPRDRQCAQGRRSGGCAGGDRAAQDRRDQDRTTHRADRR